MFYYPNVLQRHTGCFSTIWLAATGGIRVSRREFLRVNVKRTCNDILDYVMGQVPALEPNQPRPRFSLYLSSQLQYGVVVIYHKQCGFLLEEVQQTIDRWLRSKRRTQIDLAESDRMALDVPDGLNMMEEAEGAQDPFFGLMASHQLPSPYKIVLTKLEIDDLGSQHCVVSSPTTKPDDKGFILPPASITLTEKEQFVINAAEDFNGAELPEATASDIQLLMDQPDHFRTEEEGKTNKRTRDQALSSFGIQLKDTMLGTETDSMWLLDEETGGPVEVPLVALAPEMTPEHVAMPSESIGDRATESLLYEEVVDAPLRKHSGRRRRQLVFVDPEVQISDKAIQEQIANPLIETQNMMEVLLDIPALTKRASPAQLFSAPCGSLLHPSLLSLWKQRASIAVLSESGAMQRAEGELEQDIEMLRTERKRRHSCMKEISSESGLQTTEGSSVLDVMLDMPNDDRSGRDAMTPGSRCSPHEDVQITMEPIAEETLEMPEAQTDMQNMLSCIASIHQRFGEVTFDSLLPLEADRCTAARTLNKLLELLSDKQVTACQTEPYRSITIKPAALRMSI